MPKRTRNHRETLLEDLREDSQFAAAYVSEALQESNTVFLRALRDVAEAHRMAKVAEEAGLSREAIYRTLSEEGNPRFDSLAGILKAVGLKLRVEPEIQQIVALASPVAVPETASADGAVLAKDPSLAGLFSGTPALVGIDIRRPYISNVRMIAGAVMGLAMTVGSVGPYGVSIDPQIGSQSTHAMLHSIQQGGSLLGAGNKLTEIFAGAHK